MRLSLIGFICLLTVTGCERLPEEQEHPIVETLPPANLDASGVTLRMKIIREGENPILEAGFIWNFSDPASEEGYRVPVDLYSGKSEFETRLNINLAKSVTYFVRSFVRMGNLTIYGNLVTFESIQNNGNSWSFEKSLQLPEWPEYVAVASNDSLAYMLSSSNQFYSLDLKSLQFERLDSLPEMGDTYATAVMLNDVPYFAIWGYRSLYKYKNNSWILESQIPEGYQWTNSGFSYNGSIYFIGNNYLQYNSQSRTWKIRGLSPISDATNYKILGDLMYVMDRNGSISVFDFSTESISPLTSCPSYFTNATRFLIGNKIYFGIDHDIHSSITEEWFNPEFWSYDLETREWWPEQPFPQKIPRGEVFYFVSGGKLIFCNTEERLKVWSFTP